MTTTETPTTTEAVTTTETPTTTEAVTTTETPTTTEAVTTTELPLKHHNYRSCVTTELKHPQLQKL